MDVKKVEQMLEASLEGGDLSDSYAVHLKTLEESFLADTGQDVVAMVEFFEKFVQWDAESTVGEKESLAERLGNKDYLGMVNTLENRLFDYIYHCADGVLALRLVPVLMHFDREKGHFYPFLHRLGEERGELAKVVEKAAGELDRSDWEEFEVSFDVPYVKGANDAQKLDVYCSDHSGVEGKCPAILYFHGGAWAYGHRFRSIKRLRHLLGEGYVLISAGYTLSKEKSWPAQIEDCQAAIDHVISHAEEWGIDPSKIAVWGSSAGAHLGALLCCGNGEKIVGFINMCGPMNLEEYVKNATGSMREVSPVMQLLGGEGEKLGQYAREASVLHQIGEDFPASLVIHGEKDDTVPISESVAFCDRLEEVGGKVERLWLKDSGHRMDDREVMPAVLAFLGECFGGDVMR